VSHNKAIGCSTQYHYSCAICLSLDCYWVCFTLQRERELSHQNLPVKMKMLLVVGGMLAVGASTADALGFAEFDHIANASTLYGAAGATATIDANPALGFKPNIVFILTDDQDTRLSGSSDTYDKFGSLEAMPFTKQHFIEGGAHFSNAFVNTPICCPSRTEFFSGRYYHNIGPPNDVGGCMHVNTANAVKPQGMFKFLTDAGYNTGVFGKVTNDQGGILKALAQQKAVNVIDSPLDYNNYEGLTYFHLDDDGKTYTETLDKDNPEFKTVYQTAQIGNRTLRWLETAVNKTDSSGSRVPFFAYVGPHAPHYPADPAPWYEDAFPDLSIPITPNYNHSCAKKPSHIRQNPPLSELALCWENQHFRDRWRSLLSVDDLVSDIVSFLDDNNVLNETFIFYSSDHGYKQVRSCFRLMACCRLGR